LQSTIIQYLGEGAQLRSNRTLSSLNFIPLTLYKTNLIWIFTEQCQFFLSAHKYLCFRSFLEQKRGVGDALVPYSRVLKLDVEGYSGVAAGGELLHLYQKGLNLRVELRVVG
jgi:hypothetical protein